MHDDIGLLGDLDEAQRNAVTIDVPRLCIVAGPGAGKTRVLTRRVAWRCKSGVADPKRVVVLTFTRAAAVELRERLVRLDLAEVTTGTFHSVCLALLAQRFRDTGRRPPRVARSRQRILRDVLAAAGETGITAGQLDGEVSWAATRMISAERYPEAVADAGRSTVVAAERIAELMVAYQRLKRSRGVVDLDDLLRLVLEELATDPGWAAAQCWLYRHLFVDEYQDTSVPQRRLLQVLAAGRADLCLAGDPRQSIFGFAGVEAETMARVGEDFPGAVTVVLNTNYRSTARIVAAANGLIEAQLTASAEEVGAEVTVTGYSTAAEEAMAVSGMIRRIGQPWGRQAVLARTNAVLDNLEAACLARGIPTARPQDLLRRPETRPVLDWLRGLPSSTSVRSLVADFADIRAEVLESFAPPVVEEMDDAYSQPDSFGLVLARHHLDEFDDLMADYVRLVPSGRVEDFLFWLDGVVRSASIRPVPNAVQLRTIHGAKGLEWDAVFLIGCERDLLPLSGADPDEELRVAFVAVTRAARFLHVTWARQRSDQQGRVRERQPSPILARIEAGAAAVPEAAIVAAEVASERLSGMRARIGVPPSRPPAERHSRRRDTRVEALIVSACSAHARGREMRLAVVTTLAVQLGTDPENLQRRIGGELEFRRFIDNICAAAAARSEAVYASSVPM
jgi:DNA helicase-2/ATP-dependent DNA helicase PcrA